MYSVATREHSSGPHAVKQVLEADRAILAHAVLHTGVVVLQ